MPFLDVFGTSHFRASALADPLPGSLSTCTCPTPMSVYLASSLPSGFYLSITFSLRPFLATAGTISTPQQFLAICLSSFCLMFLLNVLLTAYHYHTAM